MAIRLVVSNTMADRWRAKVEKTHFTSLYNYLYQVRQFDPKAIFKTNSDGTISISFSDESIYTLNQPINGGISGG